MYKANIRIASNTPSTTTVDRFKIVHFRLLKMLLFNTLLTFFLYFTSFVYAADTNAWKSRSIYFVLTDRIARSSDDSGGGSCGNLGNYCGGTFKGLESKLDYIKGLGFDAIWITPVVASMTFLYTSKCEELVLTRRQIRLAATTAIGHKIYMQSTPITALLQT